MSLDKSYLEYPQRSYGMDHELYDWSMLTDRPAISWPDGKKLALWVNLNIDFFPLNQRSNPTGVPGGMKMPYPDLRHFSLRDYGNRIGIYRLFKALDKFGVKPTIAINGVMVERAPYLMDMIKERGDEVLGHGWQMDMIHHGEVAIDEERQWVANSLNTLRERFEQPVTGWLSPGRLQSANTPTLLKEHGVEYMCDWVNDDMPYAFNTAAGAITAMPLSNELDDFFILNNNLHSEDSYAEQIMDASDFLLSEASEQGGRLLALNIHPWMLGQPHRIGQLERVLAHITSLDGVWSASASDILTVWSQQTQQQP
ncbi:polysaccharide deacetylase family protein [Alteromonas lipolytica]|uniref:Polysaccharide deacetylase n=1 Tax=Alteromonas lipolytica TaxID=1856405 RepID=A0A1E8FBM8_9ALTE|nr:polysaccharide deacetylase family protein [Alteromonas lipolytica]OFI33332.1 polysaccharide deacetylase [Alteromonas lipolytica]GGF60637.1 polysaccharide deacetylase [Alteromonas lipolytica]